MSNDNQFTLNDPFVQFIKEAALAKIEDLEPGKIYISEVILEAIWNDTTTSEHKRAGKALSYLCDKNELPLIELEEKTVTNLNQYILRE